MNGKDCVIDAIERVERVISEIRSLSVLDGDPLLDGVVKACTDLGNVKNKVTLRTKTGANMAYPILESAKSLDEAWAEAQGGDDLNDLRERMEEFMNAVEILGGALRERTVIMT